MQKLTRYKLTKFPDDVIRRALEALWEDAPQKVLDAKPIGEMSVEIDDTKWTHDSENEFFADYRRTSGSYNFTRMRGDRHLAVYGYDRGVATVSISAPSRSDIERTFAVFEGARVTSAISPPDGDEDELPSVFIGHGRSSDWRDLKDHLHEKHGIRVVAYEIGARAGHTIRDVLEEMLEESSFALLVMTGEDAMADGSLQPRMNVVHEAGLFQGKMGFRKAIIILENGVTEFSNIHGINQLRFDKGRIKEVFGDVVATINREFSDIADDE